MANIPETPEFSADVYQIETTDKVLGGPDGVINLQAKQLADRTAFLKDAVESAADVAAGADAKAGSALAQIADVELAAGSAAGSAASALQYKDDALAAKALAELAQRTAAEDAASAAAAATGAAADRVQAGQLAAEAGAAASAAVQAASQSVSERNQVVILGEQKKSEITALADASLVELDTVRDDAVAAKDLAVVKAQEATTQAGVATDQASVASGQANIATTQAGLATTAKTAAEAARDAAQLSRGVFPTTAKALSKGVVSIGALVAGTGGANGTFDLAFSGGGGSGAAGRFVVSGGKVTDITITAKGDSYTSAPTVSFAASTGLTGASATAVIGNLVAVGDYFSVPSADNSQSLILYQNSSGTAVEQKRYPSRAAIDDIYRERFLAARADYLARMKLNSGTAKRAAVLILLGQSNNVPRGTPLSGSVSPDVYMPVGGNSMTYWAYNSLNATISTNWTDVASAVVDAQGASENPGSATALALLGGSVSRVYMCSVAKGSTSLAGLMSAGPLKNVWAAIHRLCDIARADGFEPEVVFYTHHGETDAYNGASESAYYMDGRDYYRMVQAFAADAMNRRDYDAPIAFHMPIAYGTFGTAPNMRNVARAMVRVARDIPNGILLGGAYQFLASDGVHHTNIAVRQKGEHAGYLLREFLVKNDTHQALQMVDAVWSGTTVTVLFNKEINYDTGLTFGTSLNATNALGGFEFLDDGVFIKINSITVQGRKAILTLNATPTGTTKTVQIASQTMTGTPNTFPTVAGSQIRSAASAPVGIYDHTKLYHDMAAPQTIEVRP